MPPLEGDSGFETQHVVGEDGQLGPQHLLVGGVVVGAGRLHTADPLPAALPAANDGHPEQHDREWEQWEKIGPARIVAADTTDDHAPRQQVGGDDDGDGPRTDP